MERMYKYIGQHTKKKLSLTLWDTLFFPTQLLKSQNKNPRIKSE